MALGIEDEANVPYGKGLMAQIAKDNKVYPKLTREILDEIFEELVDDILNRPPPKIQVWGVAFFLALDDDAFRAVMTSEGDGWEVVCGSAGLEALKERCDKLGIEWK